MTKFVNDGSTRFTENDIRVKTASDIVAKHATELLQHHSKALTETVYRRKSKNDVNVEPKEQLNT